MFSSAINYNIVLFIYVRESFSFTFTDCKQTQRVSRITHRSVNVNKHFVFLCSVNIRGSIQEPNQKGICYVSHLTYRLCLGLKRRDAGSGTWVIDGHSWLCSVAVHSGSPMLTCMMRGSSLCYFFRQTPDCIGRCSKYPVLYLVGDRFVVVNVILNNLCVRKQIISWPQVQGFQVVS